jgi:hypothetical protein
MDFTEFLDDGEQARVAEEERQRKEREEREKEEELNRAMEDIEQRRNAEEADEERRRLEDMSEEQRVREEERGSKDPVTSEEIFRNVNRRRASLAMTKKVDTSKEHSLMYPRYTLDKLRIHPLIHGVTPWIVSSGYTPDKSRINMGYTPNTCRIHPRFTLDTARIHPRYAPGVLLVIPIEVQRS